MYAVLSGRLCRYTCFSTVLVVFTKLRFLVKIKKSSTTPESELGVERTWMNLSVTCWFFGYGSHQPRGFFFNETLQRLRSSRRRSQRPELLRLIWTEMKGTSCCWIRTREEEEEDASASRQVFMLTISVQLLTISLWRYIFIWFFCIFVSTCLD